MAKRRLKRAGTILAACSALLLAGCGSKLADPNFAKVDTDRILSEGLGKGEWLTYGGTYDEQWFSPLDGITPANVSSLGVAWTYEFPTSQSVKTIRAYALNQAWMAVANGDAKAPKI